MGWGFSPKAARRAEKAGVEQALALRRGEQTALGGLTIVAVEAEHPLAGDAVGFVVAGSQSCYFSGDTRFTRGLAADLKPFDLDVALLQAACAHYPILGDDRMSLREAASLARSARPRWTVPLHLHCAAQTHPSSPNLRTCRRSNRTPPMPRRWQPRRGSGSPRSPGTAALHLETGSPATCPSGSQRPMTCPWICRGGSKPTASCGPATWLKQRCSWPNGPTLDGESGVLQRVLAWSPRAWIYASDDSVTPGGSRYARLCGQHTFHYALLPYRRRAEVVAGASQYCLPPPAVVGTPSPGDLPGNGSLLQVEGESVEMSALFVHQGLPHARLWNASEEEQKMSIRDGRGSRLHAVDLRLRDGELLHGGRLLLRPWGVQTVRLEGWKRP